MDLKNVFGEVIFSAAVQTIKELVMEALKAKVNLQSADLRSANLQSANLQYADLRSANLQYANLQSADLRSADLRSANLRFANLQSADLQSANLQYAENAELSIAQTVLLPEGNIVGWKKCRNNVIVKLLIDQKAKRSNSSGRKCRASQVKVLRVFGADVGISNHDGKTEYRKGEIVKCDKWDEDRWNECSGGIHFFITREEAEKY